MELGLGRFNSMPIFICRQCRYKVSVPQKRARFGMMCPECHSGNMKPIDDRRRRGGRDVGIRPSGIRLFIGGVILVLIGGVLFVYGRENWNVGKMGARLVGVGISLGIGGLICLAAGAFGIVRDLTQSD